MAGTTSRHRNNGIETRHSPSCPSARGARCNCTPKYRAVVYSRREKRRLTKTFRTKAEAKAWRADAQVALRSGTRSGAKSATLSVVAAAWLAGAPDGAVRNRSGDIYKPSVIRGYEQALRLRVLPELGALTLAEIQRADLQGFVDRLLENEYDPSTIRNTPLTAGVRAPFRAGPLRLPVNRDVDPRRRLVEHGLRADRRIALGTRCPIRPSHDEAPRADPP